jgi:hypothetical protein
VFRPDELVITRYFDEKSQVLERAGKVPGIAWRDSRVVAALNDGDWALDESGSLTGAVGGHREFAQQAPGETERP